MIILDNELKHYGVKGMRWGVRKKRYTTIQEGPQEQNGKKKKSSNLSTAKEGVDATNRAVNDIQKIHSGRVSKKERKQRIADEIQIRDNVSKMSDKELREAVNRLNMEERYTQVMRDRATLQRGESHVERYLDNTVTTLAVTSTALSIALMIKQLKG